MLINERFIFIKRPYPNLTSEENLVASSIRHWMSAFAGDYPLLEQNRSKLRQVINEVCANESITLCVVPGSTGRQTDVFDLIEKEGFISPIFELFNIAAAHVDADSSLLNSIHKKLFRSLDIGEGAFAVIERLKPDYSMFESEDSYDWACPDLDRSSVFARSDNYTIRSNLIFETGLDRLDSDNIRHMLRGYLFNQNLPSIPLADQLADVDCWEPWILNERPANLYSFLVDFLKGRPAIQAIGRVEIFSSGETVQILEVSGSGITVFSPVLQEALVPDIRF